MTTTTTVEVMRKSVREVAIAECLEVIAAGNEVNIPELARKHERSERWARGIRKEAEELLASAEPANKEPEISGVEIEPATVEPDTSTAEPDTSTAEPDTSTAEIDTSNAETEQVTDLPARQHGNGTAWAVFLGGILVSIVFNLLAVSSAPVAAMYLAPVWPLALLGSVELATRNVWPSGWKWDVLRWGATGIVAAASGYISFGHISDVMLSWGSDRVSAMLAPVAIDGAMLVAGTALAHGKASS